MFLLDYFLASREKRGWKNMKEKKLKWWLIKEKDEQDKEEDQ